MGSGEVVLSVFPHPEFDEHRVQPRLNAQGRGLFLGESKVTVCVCLFTLFN